MARWSGGTSCSVYGGVTALLITSIGLAVTTSAVSEQNRATAAAKHLVELKANEADGQLLQGHRRGVRVPQPLQ